MKTNSQCMSNSKFQNVGKVGGKKIIKRKHLNIKKETFEHKIL